MAFTMHIEALCNEAKKIQKSLPIGEEPSLSSPRIQILQRLMNLCVVLENMASEGRRQTNDFMKEILTEESIQSLVAAFPCSLPASRQLLAQLRYRTLLHCTVYMSSHILIVCLPTVEMRILLEDNRLRQLSSHYLPPKCI